MTRPIGPIVAGWTLALRPENLTLTGVYTQLTPLDASRDAAALWSQFKDAPWVWDYLFEEPPADLAAFTQVLRAVQALDGQPCFVIRNLRDQTPLGYACFWTVVPANGVIEIGNVNLSPALQQTRMATEAFYLMIKWAFAHGYRRMEWKCNALNAPSRKAAQRLGYAFEGVFRNHSVVKGRNRDTAWFAMTDDDWPALDAAYQTWLSPDNFDAQGLQKTSLADLTAKGLFARDPAQG